MSSQSTPTLKTLMGSDAYPWLLDLRLPVIGGGKFDAVDLQAIDKSPDATALRISGLDQASFETLIERHGHQFQAIQLWKCPLISDLAALEDLSQLTHLAIYWNQRATRLWDLSGNPNLVALELASLRKVQNLEPLEQAPTLQELWIGDKTWPESVIDSLEPIAALAGLRRLSVFPKRIADALVQPIGRLQCLEQLDSSTKLWTTEQSAWLRAHLPPATAGMALGSNFKFNPIKAGDVDTQIVGKGKPRLHSIRDADRIARYEVAFDQLVDRFRADPSAQP